MTLIYDFEFNALDKKELYSYANIATWQIQEWDKESNELHEKYI